jgi:hypothetical protein
VSSLQGKNEIIPKERSIALFSNWAEGQYYNRDKNEDQYIELVPTYGASNLTTDEGDLACVR